MLDYLRLLAPRHGDALRPASLVRRLTNTTPGGAMEGGDAGAGAETETDHEEAPGSDQPRRVSSIPSHLATSNHDGPHLMTDLQRSRGEPSAQTNAISPRPAPAPAAKDAIQPTAVEPSAPRRALPLQPAPFIEAMPQRRGIQAQAPALARPVTAPLSPEVAAWLAAKPVQAAQGPTIHVSIDRIEVRAPAAPAKPAPSRPRTSPPTQSLADYLRGRGKQCS
jgi:hypothetical protein